MNRQRIRLDIVSLSLIALLTLLPACATLCPDKAPAEAETAPAAQPEAPAPAETAAAATEEPVPVPAVDGQEAAPAPAPAVALADFDRIAAALDVYFRAQDDPLAEEPVTDDPSALSVGEAVNMAEDRNPQVDRAESDVEAARARTGQARAQLFPQVQAQAGVTYLDIDTPSIGNGGPLTQLAEGVIGSVGDTLTTGQLNVSQVVFAGGQIRAAIEASRYLAQSQEWQRKATVDQLELDTKQAYYNVLLARALEQVAQESITTFQRHLADAERMYDVGVISGFEVLRARTELGARQSDAVEAANAVRLAKANLRRLLSLPPTTPLRLQGSPELEPVTEPVGALVERAHAQRPELLALERGIQASEANIRRIQGQYWPRVAATGRYSESDGGSSLSSQDGLTATLGAQIDLFAGGRRKYEVVEARAELDSLRSQRAEVSDLVELDVTRAYIQLQDAAAQVLSEQGNVELAREGLRLAELRFQEGVGTQSETLDASLALTGAESALVRALYNYAVAQAALDKAVGDPVEETRPANDASASR